MLLDVISTDVFDRTIDQITWLQIEMQKKFLVPEEIKRNQECFPSKEYFTLRNAYERIRIKKLQLMRRKNQISSYISFS